MKNVLTPLAESVLVPLGLMAAEPARCWCGLETALVFSNEEIDHIMKIAKSLEDASFLIKCVSETV